MSNRNRYVINKALRAREREAKPWPANLGDGSGVIEVPGHPELWYVRPVGTGLPSVVRRGAAPKLNNYPVWVGQDVYNRRWVRVLGANLEAMSSGAGGSLVDIDPHAPTHTWGGSDIVFSDIKQIIPLNVYAKGGMVVGVRPGVLPSPNGVARVVQTSVTLTAPVSQMRFDVIQVAYATGAVSVKTGTAFDLEDYSVGRIPIADDGNMALAAVRLYTGQTEISNQFADPDILDLRFPNVSFGGGTVAARYLNYIIRYSSGVVYAYDPDAAGLTAALGAAVSGDTVVIPPYTFNDAFTVPDVVVLAGWGTTSLITGKLTVGDGCYCQNFKIEIIGNSADPIIGIQGPDTIKSLFHNVSVRVVNQGAGDARAIQCGGIEMDFRLGTFRAEAEGAGAARCLYSTGAEACRFEESDFIGSASIGAAPPANWRIAQGAEAGVIGCKWHETYDPAAATSPADNVTYLVGGDRAARDYVPAGMMSKTVYDANDDGIVDEANAVSIGGKVVDLTGLTDQNALYYELGTDTFVVGTPTVFDDNAFHDNVTNEILPVAEQTTPVVGDTLLMETVTVGTKKSLPIENLLQNTAIDFITSGRMSGKNFDIGLLSAAEGDHFIQNAASYPAGWTEVDAALTSVTNIKYSFWRLTGSDAEQTWKYRKQTGITLESLAADAYAAFHFGPILWRDVTYGVDVIYKFGMYRNNAGAIDENTYIRVCLKWNNTSGVWQVYAEEKDGSTAHASTAQNIVGFPMTQPIYFRVVVRNTAAKPAYAYAGTNQEPFSQSRLLGQSPTSAPTWGQVWLQVEMARGSGGSNTDILYIGAVDYDGSS